MLFRTLTVSVLAGAAIFSANVALAEDKEQAKEQEQTKTQERDQDRVYGWSLMTEHERIEYRAKMRSAKTAEEREAYRQEHHKLMQERAKERGVTLPDEPPMRGRGMVGPGGGMGPGGGRGPGGGMMQRGY